MYEWLPAFLEIKAGSSKPTFNMADYPYKGGGKNIYKGRHLMLRNIGEIGNIQMYLVLGTGLTTLL